MRLQKTSYLIVSFAALLFAACSKKDNSPKTASNQILGFKIVNAQHEIPATIDQSTKHITITLPDTVLLSLLQPEITVTEGAYVTPSDTVYIEDMMDYWRNGRTIEYTVTGKDSAKQTYTVSIESKQGDISYTEVSDDPDNPHTYNHTISWFSSDNYVYTYPTPATNFDRNFLKIDLVDDSGKAYNCGGQSGGTLISFSLQYVEGYKYGVTDAPPAGLYHVRIQYYSKITTLKNPIKIVYL